MRPTWRLVLLAIAATAVTACGDSEAGVSRADSAGGATDARLPVIHVLWDTAETCRTCEIEAHPLDTLVGLVDPASPMRFPRVARDSRGRTYAADVGYSMDNTVLVYDSTGTFAGELAQPGQGPGELTTVLGISMGLGDSIVVAHAPSSFSVFAPDGRFVRVVRTPGIEPRGYLVMQPDGSMLIGGNRRTPESLQLPLHLVSASGEWVRSAGTQCPRSPSCGSTPIVARSSRGRAWVTDERNYRLEAVDSAGLSLRLIAVRVGTFMGLATVAEADSIFEASPSRSAPRRPGVSGGRRRVKQAARGHPSQCPRCGRRALEGTPSLHERCVLQ